MRDGDFELYICAPGAATRPQGTFFVYPDAAGEFRWRLVRGGRVIADSGEGYKSRSRCRQMVKTLVGLTNVKIIAADL